MNVEEVIYICGLQYVCKGSEATGDMVFEAEPGNEMSIPVCTECMEALLALDNDTDTLLD